LLLPFTFCRDYAVGSLFPAVLTPDTTSGSVVRNRTRCRAGAAQKDRDQRGCESIRRASALWGELLTGGSPERWNRPVSG
jgi:hypothetical protein